jgi:hypothetical protein
MPYAVHHGEDTAYYQTHTKRTVVTYYQGNTQHLYCTVLLSALSSLTLSSLRPVMLAL